MGRVKGRFFNNDFDLNRINRDIAQEQAGHGTSVAWYFYQGAALDDTYDEGGRRWTGPKNVPVVSAVPAQGANRPSDTGQYITDHITLRMSYRQIAGDTGFTMDLSTNFEQHYADRFVFRGHVYSVQEIRMDGHFDPAARDVMVRVEGGQLRPDELVNDIDFQEYAA
jgi:hypothetical protein